MTPNTPRAMRETPMPEHLTTESALRLDLEAALAQIKALQKQLAKTTNGENLVAAYDHTIAQLRSELAAAARAAIKQGGRGNG